MLGTAGQIATGVVGIDLPGNIRDITSDVANWKWSWGHVGQTVGDAVAFLPVIGALKYSDEIGTLAKNAVKSSDEIADGAKGVRKTAKQFNEIAQKLGYDKTSHRSHGQPVFYNKKTKKYITPDTDQHNGGVWKMADSIDNLKSKKDRMGTYDIHLNRIGD